MDKMKNKKYILSKTSKEAEYVPENGNEQGTTA
jgi:hypothetical protein